MHRIQKRGLNFFELQLQVVMNHSAWMLGTEFWSSRRAGILQNPRAISLAPQINFERVVALLHEVSADVSARQVLVFKLGSFHAPCLWGSKCHGTGCGAWTLFCFLFDFICGGQGLTRPGLASLTTPPRMTLNFSPSCFYCGPPRLVCTVLETKPWTSRVLGKHSTKRAACPALFCFLSTALETQGFPHTEHKQQGLFCTKCSLLIAGPPFLASVCWQVADRHCQ